MSLFAVPESMIRPLEIFDYRMTLSRVNSITQSIHKFVNLLKFYRFLLNMFKRRFDIKKNVS